MQPDLEKKEKALKQLRQGDRVQNIDKPMRFFFPIDPRAPYKQNYYLAGLNG